MHKTFTSCSRTGVQCLHKLWLSTPTSPQVVFATGRLRTSPKFVSSFSERLAQLCALIFYAFHEEIRLFIHAVHSPNNKYYKGE